ncbi:MAG: hypothetical protein IJG23_01705 [Clostridia bacterium]|nr:hypothetical protein [Clostridia bacterium]
MKKILCVILAISVLLSTLSVCFVSFAEQSYMITTDAYCYATGIGGNTVTQASAGQTISPMLYYEKIDPSKNYVKGFTLTTSSGSTFLGTDESFQMPAEAVSLAAVIAEKATAVILLKDKSAVKISEKSAYALMESDWVLLGADVQGTVLDFNADSKGDAVIRSNSSGFTIALIADSPTPFGTYTQDLSHLGCFFPYTSIIVKIVNNKVATVKTNKIVYRVHRGSKIIISVVVRNNEGVALANKYVRLDLYGKHLTLKTNANGVVRFTVGSKVYEGQYAGKAFCEGISSSFKVKVVKMNTKIIAKSKAFKAKTKVKKIAAVLKDENNKPIQKVKLALKVNGKVYKALTNSKGKAVIKITKLKKKGTYNAVVSFVGTNYYNGVSKKITIKVK